MFQHAQRICVFALATFGLYAQTNVTPPVQVTRTTGIVGIAEGQTAQLNALNPGITPAGTTGTSCSALLAFVADDGTELKTKIVNVSPGTSQPLVIDSILDLNLAVNTRRQIRATVTIPPVPPPSTAPVTAVCKLIGTLEIFNTLDGHTLVTLGASHEVPAAVATPVTTSGSD
jgi:hypothetical protein